MTQRPDSDLDAHSTSDHGVTRVWVESDGRTIGTATVSREGTTVMIVFAMAHGHLPISGRRRLIHATFSLPEVEASHHPVQVAIPIGDVELLDGVRDHVEDVTLHAAGATCLIEARTR